MVERLNKKYYKLFLIILKYTPFILMIIDLLSTSFSYFNISCNLLSYIGGVSLIFLIILYILSTIFKYCTLYRFPLYYITVTNIIAIVDNYYKLPLSDLNLLRLYFVILGLLFVVYVKIFNKRSTTEVSQWLRFW